MSYIELSEEQHHLFNHDRGILLKLAERNSPNEFIKTMGWFNSHEGRCYICQHQMYPPNAFYDNNISNIVRLHGIEHIKKYVAFL